MLRLKILSEHFVATTLGTARLFFRHPWFMCRLFFKRLRFFLLRDNGAVMLTPEGIVLDSPQVLISYWTFFVEEECLSSSLVSALRKAESPVVLDIGANAGVFTAVILQINPAASLIAVDPLEKMTQKIQRWVAQSGKRVNVIHAAAGAVNGSVTLRFDSDADTDARVGEKPQSRFSTTVPMRTVDDIAAGQKVFLLKIDVQGYESEVLKGAKSTLQRTQFLLLEIDTDEELRRLSDQLGNDWSYQRVSRCDYLFSRRGLN